MSQTSVYFIEKSSWGSWELLWPFTRRLTIPMVLTS